VKGAKRELAYLSLALADSLVQTGNLQRALVRLKKAKKILKVIDKIKQSLPLSRMGIIYNLMGEYERSFWLAKAEYNLAARYSLTVKDAEATHMLALACMNLGIGQTRMFNNEKALPYLKRSIDLLEELLGIDPDNAQYKMNLSEIFSFLGKHHEGNEGTTDAAFFYRKSNDLAKELVEMYPNSLRFKEHMAISSERLATACMIGGNLDDALEHFANCEKIINDLLEYLPDKLSLRILSANLFLQVAKWNKYKENYNAAITNLKTAKDMYAGLSELIPDDFTVKESLAMCDKFLGEMFDKTGQPDKAFFHYREFYSAALQLYAKCSGNRTIKQHLATSHEYLTRAYQRKEDLENAMLHCAQAWHISQRLYEADPDNEELMLDFAVINRYTGEVFWLQGEFERAEPFLLEMERLFKALYAINPDNETYHHNMGFAMTKMFTFHEEWLKSTSINPKLDALIDRVLSIFFR